MLSLCLSDSHTHVHTHTLHQFQNHAAFLLTLIAGGGGVDITVKFIKLGTLGSSDRATRCEQGHGYCGGGWLEAPVPGSLRSLSLSDRAALS